MRREKKKEGYLRLSISVAIASSSLLNEPMDIKFMEEEEDCDEGSSIRGASFERCGNFTPDRCQNSKRKRELFN